jgi:hypothetical protein
LDSANAPLVVYFGISSKILVQKIELKLFKLILAKFSNKILQIYYDYDVGGIPLASLGGSHHQSNMAR